MLINVSYVDAPYTTSPLCRDPKVNVNCAPIHFNATWHCQNGKYK